MSLRFEMPDWYLGIGKPTGLLSEERRQTLVSSFIQWGGAPSPLKLKLERPTNQPALISTIPQHHHPGPVSTRCLAQISLSWVHDEAQTQTQLTCQLLGENVRLSPGFNSNLPSHLAWRKIDALEENRALPFKNTINLRRNLWPPQTWLLGLPSPRKGLFSCKAQ